MIIHDVEQGTPEWLELRRGIVTASEASKLVSPTGKLSTQIEGYSEILAAEIAGAESEFFETYDMKQGKLREPAARAQYSLDHGPVQEIGFITNDSGTCGFSPDGGVLKDGKIIGGLEIKCRKLKNFLSIIRSKIPVVADKPQIQFGLWITGWEFIDQVWDYPGLKNHIQRFIPDYEFFDLFENQVAKCILMRDTFFETYLNTGIQKPVETETEIEF